jgi:ABC-type multidrug transport system fused ATPase/permease subunit
VNAYLLLLSDLVTRLRWRFPVLIVWTALVGFSEGLAVILLLPLLNRVGVAAAGGQSAATSLINRCLALIDASGIFSILAVVIVIATIQTMLSILLNWWTVRLARNYQAQCQLEMFSAFMRAKWAFFADRKVGELTNAIVTESERLGRAFTMCLSILGSAVVVVIYIALALLIAWQATLVLVGFALAVGLLMARFYKDSYAVGERLAPLNAQLQSFLDEHFSGAKFIKASAGVERAIAQAEPLVRVLCDVNARATAAPGIIRASLEYVALIGLAVILVVAAKGLGLAPANVVIVLALFGRLFPRMTTVQSQLYSLNNNVQAIEVIDKLQVAAEAEAERQGSSTAPLQIDRPAGLVVRDLRVRFGDRVVLDGIDLTLPIPGMLVIVGRSGAGKSTLVHALLGLADPSAGSIRLGKYELASTQLDGWRRAIGYVPQETALFHASIIDNLRFVNFTASETEVEAAARRAHALDFINALPRGFDTVIGDQGVKLSGGQRQRLGIARALLTNPALLILDEAMSALDTQSEAELLRTLEELRKEMGVLLISHRLAAARAADAICVFEAGRIVETGTWNELIARKSSLYALAEAQSFDDRVLVAI